MNTFLKTATLLMGMLLLLQPASAQSFRTGSTTITFNDPARTGGFGSGGGTGRQIQTEIYYPSIAGGVNAAPAQGSFPLVIFGHGFVMSWDAYQPFYDSLSKLGYIVALPRTEGGAIPFPVHTDFAKDLAIVATKMSALNTAASSPFYQKLNGKVAIGGHSMGGGCTFLADQYTSLPVCYFSMAAAETNPSAVTAAANIRKPHLVIGGSLDCVAPPASNQDLMFNALGSSCKDKAIITGALHCQFNATNTTCALGEATCLPSGAISRQTQINRVLSLLIPYLDYYLKGSCPAWDRYQQAMQATGIVSVRNCVQTVPQGLPIQGNALNCNQTQAALSCSESGFNYAWSNGSAAQNTQVQSSGSYSLTISNAYCSIAAPAFNTELVFSPDTPQAASPLSVLCPGTPSATFELSADPNTDYYLWTAAPGWQLIGDDSTSQIQVLHSGLPGTLEVLAHNRCGQTAAAFTFTADSLPSLSGAALVSPAFSCPGQTGILVSVTPSANTLNTRWNLPAGWTVQTSSTQQITLQSGNTAGTGLVFAENGCGNSDTLQFLLQLFPPAQPTISATADTLWCNEPGTFYTWMDSGTVAYTSALPYYPNAANGNYTVTVVDTNGCIYTSPIFGLQYTGVAETKADHAIPFFERENNCISLPDGILWAKALVYLLSADGKKVPAIRKDNKLLLPSLAAGVYVLVRETPEPKAFKISLYGN